MLSGGELDARGRALPTHSAAPVIHPNDPRTLIAYVRGGIPGSSSASAARRGRRHAGSRAGRVRGTANWPKARARTTPSGRRRDAYAARNMSLMVTQSCPRSVRPSPSTTRSAAKSKAQIGRPYFGRTCSAARNTQSHGAVTQLDPARCRSSARPVCPLLGSREPSSDDDVGRGVCDHRQDRDDGDQMEHLIRSADAGAEDQQPVHDRGKALRAEP